MKRHASTHSAKRTGFHLEQVRFERIFDAPGHTGLFSFEAGGQRQFGVDLLDSEVPREGSHYAFVLAEPGNWQTLLGWRDLSTPDVVVRDTTRQCAPYVVSMAYSLVPMLMAFGWLVFGAWTVPVIAVLALCAAVLYVRLALRRSRTIERMLCEVPPQVPPGAGRKRMRTGRQRLVKLLFPVV